MNDEQSSGSSDSATARELPRSQAAGAPATSSNDAGKNDKDHTISNKLLNRSLGQHESEPRPEPAKQADLSEKLDDFWDMSHDAVESDFRELDELFAPSDMEDTISVPESSKDVSRDVIGEYGAASSDSSR